MFFGPEILLVISVAVVGVLHTIVPDHWAPIAFVARQRGWTRTETALAAVQAGTGHVVSTLMIAAVIAFAGVEVAAWFGHIIDTAASLALIGFGLWIAVSSWRELNVGHAHTHTHGDHEHSHDDVTQKAGTRTALLLILGSSPMIEGIPAFFAAAKYGVGLIILMSIVFAISTILTYVVLCVYSTVRLRRLHLGPLERYGEVISGIFIAFVGVVFWLWPVI